MFCPRCGSQIPDNSNFCPRCAASLTGQSPAQAPVQPPVNFGQPVWNAPVAPAPQALPLKWFKFLIYFALWAGAVGNLITAITFLTGVPYTMYGSSAEEIYSALPALRVIDILYAIVLIGLSVYAFYVRSRLAHFKANGPTTLYWLCGLLGGASAGYSLLVMIAAETVNFSGVISSVASTVIILLLERTYFQKRANMFVN